MSSLIYIKRTELFVSLWHKELLVSMGVGTILKKFLILTCTAYYPNPHFLQTFFDNEPLHIIKYKNVEHSSGGGFEEEKGAYRI